MKPSEMDAEIDKLQRENRRLTEKLREAEVDKVEAQALVARQQEWIEGYHAAIEAHDEAFQPQLDEATGKYVFEFGPRDAFDRYDKLRRQTNWLVTQHQRGKRERGRPLEASDSQIATVHKLRQEGKSLRGIALNTALGLKTVRTILAHHGKEAAAKEKHAEKLTREHGKIRAANHRVRKRTYDALPGQTIELRKEGEALIAAGKGALARRATSDR